MAYSPDDTLADAYFISLIECNRELNEGLSRYRVIPQIHPIGDGPLLYFRSYKPNDGYGQEQYEIGAVMCALQLADRNQIDDVRERSCGTFFVAGRIDKSHCSTKCRVKAHQSSEEFKAKRREADRERYRLHRDGKVKQPNRRKSNGTQKAR